MHVGFSPHARDFFLGVLRACSGFLDDLPGLLDCRGAERFGLRACLRLCEIELRRQRLLGFAPHAPDFRREVLFGLTSNSLEFRDQCLARRRFGGRSCFDNRGLALLRRLASNARKIMRALPRGFGLDSRNLAGTMLGRLGFDAGELACLLPGGFGLETFDLALQPVFNFRLDERQVCCAKIGVETGARIVDVRCGCRLGPGFFERDRIAFRHRGLGQRGRHLTDSSVRGRPKLLADLLLEARPQCAVGELRKVDGARLIGVCRQAAEVTDDLGPLFVRHSAPEKDDIGNALVHRHDRGLGGGHHLELGAELRAYK